MRLSKAAAWVPLIVTVTCGLPRLEDLPCTRLGECLPGYRCRAGQCISLRPEFCDGEDNDGDGFVDEDLFRATPLGFEVLSISADLRAAYRDGVFLFVWPSRLNEVTFLLADELGRALAGPTVLPDAMDAVIRLAVVATPDRFWVVVATPNLDRYLLRLWEISPQGVASEPELLETVGVPDSLEMTYDGNGLAVAILQRPSNCCGPGIANAAQGVFLLRPGEAPLRLAQESVETTVEGPIAATGELGQAGVSVSWIERRGGTPTGKVWRQTGTIHEIPQAHRLALGSWGGELVVAAVEGAAGETPRLLLHRYAASSTEVSEPLVVSDSASEVLELRVAPAPTEIGVFWRSQLAGQFARFGRVNPNLGRVGSVVSLDTSATATLGGTVFSDSGYTLALASPFRMIRFACVGAAP